LTASAAPPASISVRLVWPYLRLRDGNGYRIDLSQVSSWLVDPDARIPHAEVIRLMLLSIEQEADPARGLKAAALAEAADREPVEHAARGQATLGEALASYCRWFPVLNSASELSLHPMGDRTEVRYRVVRGAPEPPSFADSVVAGLLYFARRYVDLDPALVELGFRQGRPSYASDYAATGAKHVHFGAEHDCLRFTNEQLESRLAPQSPTLTRAYELRAEELLRRLLPGAHLRDRLRKHLGDHLEAGVVNMQWAAAQFEMSVPTLRRRLRDEGTTFSAVMDQVRSELADRKLHDGRASMSEIADALGFAHASAFKRALKRWSQVPPALPDDKSD
jgi:AraC-like DNA-binding protein